MEEIAAQPPPHVTPFPSHRSPAPPPPSPWRCRLRRLAPPSPRFPHPAPSSPASFRSRSLGGPAPPLFSAPASAAAAAGLLCALTAAPPRLCVVRIRGPARPPRSPPGPAPGAERAFPGRVLSPAGRPASCFAGLLSASLAAFVIPAVAFCLLENTPGKGPRVHPLTSFLQRRLSRCSVRKIQGMMQPL
ncbi:uncharacterized protein LOC110197986 [Phascolarctos cinereus]